MEQIERVLLRVGREELLDASERLTLEVRGEPSEGVLTWVGEESLEEVRDVVLEGLDDIWSRIYRRRRWLGKEPHRLDVLSRLSVWLRFKSKRVVKPWFRLQGVFFLFLRIPSGKSSHSPPLA